MLTVKEAIEQRRSVRKFKPDPVQDEDITELLNAARLAPSGCNAIPVIPVGSDSSRDPLRTCPPATHEESFLNNPLSPLS
jgi:nitroreductase